MVYGYAARATVPAARIRSIDVSAAEQAEGVLLVLKGGDIPGGNLIGILPPFDQPVLATEVVRYAGESLALVVAETAEAAKRGARLVKADLEPLEADPDDRRGARRGRPGHPPEGQRHLLEQAREGRRREGLRGRRRRGRGHVRDGEPGARLPRARGGLRGAVRGRAHHGLRLLPVAVPHPRPRRGEPWRSGLERPGRAGVHRRFVRRQGRRGRRDRHARGGGRPRGSTGP